MISRVSLGSIPQAHLLVGSAASDAGLHATSRKVVHHRHALGHLDRVMVRQYHDAEAQPDTACHAGQRRQYDLGGRGAGERGQEVVLDEPEVVEPDLVGQDALLQRLLDQHLVVDLEGRAGPLHLVEQSKLHRGLP